MGNMIVLLNASLLCIYQPSWGFLMPPKWGFGGQEVPKGSKRRLSEAFIVSNGSYLTSFVEGSPPRNGSNYVKTSSGLRNKDFKKTSPGMRNKHFKKSGKFLHLIVKMHYAAMQR